MRLALCMAAGLVLAGCGGAKIGSGSTAAGGVGAKACGTVNMAVNAWVGYAADAAVVDYILRHQLGCNVVDKHLDEQVSWQGFATGQVDVILENWGHDDLKKRYIDQQKVAVDFGPSGNIGVIGWFVPPWMAQKYPDITDWHNLNKYAALFRTSESGGKGQLLDGDPSYVTNDAALVQNLHLNYKVVYAGSETALIQAFRRAQRDKTPLLGYFYEPQWFLSEVKLVQVQLPAYRPGCDADPQKVACGYPLYHLDKIVSTRFADSGSPAVQVIKNFSWTNDDQNAVAKDIAENHMSPEAAAAKWVQANPGTWKAWLPKG